MGAQVWKGRYDVFIGIDDTVKIWCYGAKKSARPDPQLYVGHPLIDEGDPNKSRECPWQVTNVQIL